MTSATISAPQQKRLALKNILVATDFSSASNRALDYAMSFAHRYKSSLHLAHILCSAVPAESGIPGTPAAQKVLEINERKQAISRLKNLADCARRECLRTETVLLEGPVGITIRNLVVPSDIGLVVAGTHGYGESLTMGSVAEEIFREVPCPVLTVGPQVGERSDFQISFRHILFATDFSPESAKATPLAISLAEEYCCRLTVVHALPEELTVAAEIEGRVKKYEKQLRCVLSPAWLHSIRANFLLETGTPGRVILDFARDHEVDLIILGVKKSARLEQRSFSRTAYNVASHSDCPVLTVRGDVGVG